MRFRSIPVRALSLSTALLVIPDAPLAAQPRDADLAALREQIRQLDQQLRVLERKQELRDEEAFAAARATPSVTVNDRGFTFASGDGAHSLRLRGLIQADSRWYLNDGGIANNDAFILRRARIIAEGAFNRWVQYQIVPEFGGGSTTLLDANLTLALSPKAQLKLGKYKSPVGLEQLQSDSWAFFTERSLVSGFVPNRDIGVQLSGDLLGDGWLNYTVGVFNGVPDGTSNTNNADFDDDKEFVARLFAHPFKTATDSPFAGLGFGVAVSLAPGSETAAALTSGYRTEGQQRFFAYGAHTVADGDTWRLSPQAYLYSGSFGAQVEYVQSVVNVRSGTNRAELKHEAWQASAGYVLTGEKASYHGVAPRQNFTFGGEGWGAFEIVGRVSHASIDAATFPLFANPAANASSVTTYGLGLNWYLTRSLRAALNYFHTEFDTALAPSTALLREGENALITRLQLAF